MNAIPAKVAGVAAHRAGVPDPRRRGQPPRPGRRLHRRAWTRSIASAARRPWRRSPTAPRPSPRWTRSSAPATSTSPPPSALFTAGWTSTWWPGRARSSWSTTARASPAHVAADLLSQAEHDEMATAVLATTDAGFARRRGGRGGRQLGHLTREDTARKSWEERGAIFVAASLDRRLRVGQPFRPRAPGIGGGGALGSGQAHPPRGSHFPRPPHSRGVGRLRGGSQPRASHGGDGALLLAPGGGGFHQTLEPHRFLREALGRLADR